MATAEEAVLMVAGDRRELTGVLARCRDVRRLRLGLPLAVRATLCGRPVLLGANGPGAALAAEAVRRLATAQRLCALVSTGCCGALDPSFAPGEVVVATEVCLVPGELRFAARLPAVAGPHRTARLVSVERIVVRAAEKAALRPYGEAVEMEAAAVARESQVLGVPFYAVRVVLDGAGESFQLDYNVVRGADGRFSARRLLWAALRRPRVAREVLELRRRLRSVAEVLGEFLAGCEF
ncbi:MAG: hypothetical protein RMI94_08195 [Bryobacterales bacterium]|nr:hypothetical protein [Bryobacteraceae bacterium]MDW8130516.1 hypothetical protein [Bryobacterales bacterium]